MLRIDHGDTYRRFGILNLRLIRNRIARFRLDLVIVRLDEGERMDTFGLGGEDYLFFCRETVIYIVGVSCA